MSQLQLLILARVLSICYDCLPEFIGGMEKNPKRKAENSKSSKNNSKRPKLCENENHNRNWAEINPDVLSVIFTKVGAIDLLKHAQFVCKPWRSVSFYPSIWKMADFTTLRWDCTILKWDSTREGIGLDKMTREAVDRSKGQMEEVWINYFGSDELLSYVADRTSVLKRLHLISAYEISDEALIDIVKRQPQLEELDITFGEYSREIFKEIGKACPNLRCLRYNQRGERYNPFEYDVDASDIAKSMPELRVLQLVGNTLTNNGLIEILDKCKYLERLDIRCCFAVDVNAEIKAKAKGLKEFRLPLDSTDDYGFVAEVEYSDDDDDEEEEDDADDSEGDREEIRKELRDLHHELNNRKNRNTNACCIL